MELPVAIRAVTERRNLSAEEMRAVMRKIMTGEATPSQVGGFLIGLRMKGETPDEIAASAQVMRELATPVKVADTRHLIDTCGTGGDGAATFNISTAAALVVAAAGGKVAKHGNRSVSSKSGSADVLEAAGVNLDLSPERIAACIDQIGVGFLFAPRHHTAMKHAIGPRKEMGVRTIFNILGPLTNPAGARQQIIGVFQRELLQPMAEVLRKLGSRHVLVVHAEDGLDEISLSAATHVAELKNGEIKTYKIAPEDFGLRRAPLAQLSVDSAANSLKMIQSALTNEAGAARDIVALNAGAALYVAGLADSLKAGVAAALVVLASGRAWEKLQALSEFSRRAA